jgi:hypothetical protein
MSMPLVGSGAMGTEIGGGEMWRMALGGRGVARRKHNHRHQATREAYTERGPGSHLHHRQDTHRHAGQQRHVWTRLPAPDIPCQALHANGD